MAISGVFFVPHPPILVSEVGRGQEKEADDILAGFEALNERAQALNPEAVLLITPHGPMFRDAACVLAYEEYTGGLEAFGVREGPTWKFSHKLAQIVSRAFAAVTTCIYMNEAAALKYGVHPGLDHGAAVPMRLLSTLAPLPLLCVTPGFLGEDTLYAAGAAIGKALSALPMRVLVIASGDLSHAHKGGPSLYAPESERFDECVRDALARGDAKALLALDEEFTEKAAQCALKPFLLALGMLDELSADFSVTSCRAPFGVGYLTAMALPNGKSRESYINQPATDEYVALARAAVAAAVGAAGPIDWDSYKVTTDDDFAKVAGSRHAGVFVSIHKAKELRGCIGTISPVTDCVAREIIYCAGEASLRDPRFMPLDESELPYITVKVDILGESEPTSEDELNATKYGVIVQRGTRRGLLLPNLEGVETPQQQISIAREKAGIGEDEPIELLRFEVERHE